MSLDLAGKPGSLPSAQARPIPQAAALTAAYVTLALLLAVPLLVAEVPLSMDSLNHFARIHVRANIAHDPDLARLFEVRDGLVPYMGLDWLLTPLARVLPTLVAGRVGIVLILWGTVGAAMVLRRTFSGRVGYEPLLVGLVAYNALLAAGFLNYLVGVVGALLGLAAWHAARDRAVPVRVLAGMGVATGLFLTHLLSLALYGLMLGAYEAFGRPRAWRTPVRDWLVLAIGFAPSVLLWLLLAPPALPPRAESGYHWLLNMKAIVLLSTVYFSPAGGGVALGFSILAGCAALGVILTRRGLVFWDRRLAAPAAVLMIAGLVVPTWAMGVYLVDMRFPAVGAVLAAAALRVAPGAGVRLLPVALLLAVAVTAEVGFAAAAMHACDGQYRELRAGMQALPRGAVLDAVAETESPVPGVPCTALPIHSQMAQLVTVERSGYSPAFFATVTAVGVRGGLPSDSYPTPAHLVTADRPPRHGHLLWMHMGNHRPVPPGMTLLHAGSFFDLFSIP